LRCAIVDINLRDCLYSAVGAQIRFGVFRQPFQLRQGVREMNPMRIDDICDDGSVRLLGEEDEVWPDDLHSVAAFICHSERILTGSVRIAIPSNAPSRCSSASTTFPSHELSQPGTCRRCGIAAVALARVASAAITPRSPLSLSKEIINAVMDARAVHTTTNKQAIGSEKVRGGVMDILLGPAQLYEALRDRAGEQR